MCVFITAVPITKLFECRHPNTHTLTPVKQACFSSNRRYDRGHTLTLALAFVLLSPRQLAREAPARTAVAPASALPLKTHSAVWSWMNLLALAAFQGVVATQAAPRPPPPFASGLACRRGGRSQTINAPDAQFARGWQPGDHRRKLSESLCCTSDGLRYLAEGELLAIVIERLPRLAVG